MRNLLRVILCGLFLFLLAASANAQFRASIQGTVKDTSGALVPSATVTLTNKETNKSETTTTSDGGFYRFSGLAPGAYTLTVEKQSFKKQVVDDIAVEAESVKGVDVELAAGVISEVVTVTSENVPLETEDANVRKTLTTPRDIGGGPVRVEQKNKSFGGSFGGPIRRNRLFFFFAYEGLRSSSNILQRRPTCR